MKKREWLSLFMLAFAAAAAIWIGVNTIYVTGVDGSRLTSPETKQLLTEVLILFAVAGGILCLVRERRLQIVLL